MNIVPYEKSFYNIWNDFLKSAKNYHFFFHRDYLKYHEDRFCDHSLLIYNKSKLIALLPANIQNSTLYSHQGLTYGGLIIKDKMKIELMLEIFKTLKEFLISKNINKLIYKTMPYIHHKKPSSEDLYALFLNRATLIKREVSSVINLSESIKYSNGRKWSLKRAKNEQFIIKQSSDFKTFWAILEDILKKHHNSKPTHSLKEIEYLYSKFRDNIKLFLIDKDHVTIAGAVVYENPTVAHLQYVANSDKGRGIGALDVLIDHLIKNIYKDKKYFSFGTSSDDTKEGGINFGLIDQKERFGASAIVIDRYEWNLT